jgi:hypothetical protein
MTLFVKLVLDIYYHKKREFLITEILFFYYYKFKLDVHQQLIKLER